MLGCHGKFRSLRAYRIEGKRPAGWCTDGPLAQASLEPCLVDSSRRAGIRNLRNPNRKRSSAAPSWGCYADPKRGATPSAATEMTVVYGRIGASAVVAVNGSEWPQ